MTVGNIEVVFPPAFPWFDHDPADMVVPDVDAMFTAADTQTDIPDAQLGFLMAQGWVPTASAADPAIAGGKLWTIQRDTFSDNTALLDILTDYTTFYNDATIAEDGQYDSVVELWSDALLKTQSQLDRAAQNYNGYEVAFLSSLSDIVDQVYTRANTMLAGVSTTFDEVTAALNTYADELSKLGTGYDEYETAIEAILTTQTASLNQFVGRAAALLTQLSTDWTTHDTAITDLETAGDSALATHVTAYEAKLDAMETAVTTVESELDSLIADASTAYTSFRTEVLAILSEMDTSLSALTSGVSTQLGLMDTAVDAHEVTVDGILALYTSDYGTHAALTRGYLTDLGTTELARINEQFNNLLAGNRQALVGRGLYAAALVTQTDARVERERSEAITSLNDRLNREKLEHEHRLYGELTSVRDKNLAGQQYLHALDDATIKYRADWTLKLHEQTVSFKQVVVGMRGSLLAAQNQFIDRQQAVEEKLFGWGQDARKASAAGKDQVYRLREAVKQWKGNNEFKLAAELTAVRAAYDNLYKAELDARNKVDAFAADGRKDLLTLLNSYISTYANGVNAYARTTLTNGQFLAGSRENVIQDIMKSRFQFAAGLTTAEMEQQKLHKFQLNERNNLAVGLFRYMGDRKWDKPDMQEFGRMIMAVGHSGEYAWGA